MSEMEFPMFPFAQPQVSYRSFLLRLRQVTEKGECHQRYFLQDIQTKEQFYFVDPQEMMRFLQAYVSSSAEMDS
jgi:hypothetical protein